MACAAALTERRRLARDLHDRVSQTLLGLHWAAQAAAEQWDTQPAQARAALETVRHLAAAASTELRAVLLDLHDAVLEQQGLVAALEAFAAVVRQRSGVPVELRVALAGGASGAGPPGPGERLPWAQEEALYYVAREALINVVKHARARHATVTLEWAPTVRLVVDDDGVGFGTPPEPAAYTYGLAGMGERFALLGGRLRLENRPAGGACVVADLSVGEVTER